MRRALLLIIASMGITNTFAQNCELTNNTIVANTLCPTIQTALNTDSYVLKARDGIIFQPGFRIGSTQLVGHSFTAIIDNTIANQLNSYEPTTVNSTPPAALDQSICIPGTIGGGVDVSSSGAASYQLPIQVSPGSNGMQPNLSIVYSSHSGNGLLGWGWNLAGLSSISRVSKNKYYDNSIDAISLTVNDAFALDGARLISTSTAGTYYPANNPYTKVVLSSNTFTVTTQNGVVMEYGKEGNSLFYATYSALPITYAISRITDPNGNYIQFIYAGDISSGEYRISEIKYTGNSISGSAPYNSVKFYYDKRTDTNSMYVAGSMSTRSLLLTSIKVFCEGSLSKDYEFTYFNDQYSKLYKISLTTDGVKYNPTYIKWDTSTDYAVSQTSALLGSLRNYQLYTGDFNDDGLIDIAEWDRSNKIDVKIAQSGGSYLTQTIDLPVAAAPYYDEYSVLNDVYTIKDVKVSDRNNDAKDEIVVHYTNFRDEYFYETDTHLYSEVDIVNGYYYTSTSTPFQFTSIITSSLPLNSTNPTGDEYKYYYADLNNDGVVETLTTKNNTLFSCTGVPQANIPAFTSIEDIKFTDFDGDGRTDFLTLNSEGNGSIWELDGTTVANRFNTTTPVLFGKTDNFFTGDFNGDGKTDYLSFYSGVWHLYFSTGTTFSLGTIPVGFSNYEPANTGTCSSGTTLYPATTVCIDDINNDGKSDIIYTLNGNVSIFISNGCTLEVKKSTAASSNTSIKKIYITTTDLDSDGKKEIVYGNDGLYLENFQKISFGTRLDQGLYVNSITDGLSNTSTFTYSNHSDTRVFNSAYPLKLVRGSMRLATNLLVKNGATTFSNVTYTFTDGYQNQQGLGFLGFKTITSANSVNSTSSTSNFSYVIPNATGIYSPWLTDQTTTRGNTSISVTNNTIEAKKLDLTKKSFVPVITSSTSVNGYTGITAITTSSFDEATGRVTGQTTTDGIWTVSSSTTYTPINGYVSRPTSSTHTRSNGTSHTENTTYAYGSPYPFVPTSITTNGVTTSYTVSSYGNIIGTSLGDRSTSNAYDDKGRFVVSSTNVAGYTTTATYRPVDGAKLSETNPNGLTTTYSYTASGGSLVTKVFQPDGNTVTRTLGWDPGDYLYFTKEEVSHGNTATAYFNTAGRKSHETFTGFNSTVHTVDYTYNADGSLNSEAKSGILTATTYSYYGDGRVNSVTGQNLSTTYSYNERFVTTTDNITGITQTKEYDAMSNVVQLESTTGDISYTYNPLSKVTGISTGSSSTSMIYDPKGNQITLTDPDAGTTTYTYTAYNELETQTDAKGQVTTCTYDFAGRLIAKSATGEIGLTQTYTYDETTKRKGLLKSTTRDGVTESYTYDDLGRLTATKVTTDTDIGKTFTTTLQYNDYGQLYQVTYPSGLIARYGYDGVGNLISITDATTSTVLWTGVKNDREQWAEFTLGNGLTTKWGYDANYRLKSIQTGTSTSPTSVQNLGFTFNTMGQLTARTDGSLSESFGYDALNRLTTDTTGAKINSYAFSSNGNIDNTTLAGSYSYLPAHPHAVSSVAGVSSTGSSDSLITTSTLTADNMISTMDNVAYKNVFAYGPSGGRFKVDRYQANSLVSSKFYAGGSEFIYSSTGALVCKRTMVYAPTGICAVYQDSAGVKNFYYIHTDHLGSWLKITDQSANVKNRYSYDAWGRPRSPSTWALMPIGISDALINNLNAMQPRFDRGYTGHEHMCGFGLINMNGRLYDPYLQRFLSPDNYVQSPGNAQSYNRYTYCLNNPLMYTDPSGWNEMKTWEDFWSVVSDLWNSPNGGSWSSEGGTTYYSGDGGSHGDVGSGDSGGITSTTTYSFYLSRFEFNRSRNMSFWASLKDAFIPTTTYQLSNSNNVDVITGSDISWSFPNSEGGIDMDKTIDYLNANSTPSYIKGVNGHCARTVIESLVAGGATYRVVKNSAKNFDPTLKDMGLKPVNVSSLGAYTPQRGDVAILQAWRTHTDGHMEMWNGTQWVSDYKQGSFFYPWKGSIGADDLPSFTIYRLP